VSISYRDFYNITAGIYTTFVNKKANKKSYVVNHNEEKRNSIKELTPYNKFYLATKENLVIANLYINFKQSPTSLMDAFKKLAVLDMKEAIKFKNEIINYRKLSNDDINSIMHEETNITLNYMLNKYKLKQIHWFTLYFFIIQNSKEGLNDPLIKNSIINNKVINKIKKLKLYITFSSNGLEEINKLYENKMII